MTIRTRILAVAVLAASLGACTPSAPDHATADNEAMSELTNDASPAAADTKASSPATEPEVNAADDAPPPEAPATNTAADAEETVAPDEQMLDDASATGMTSRASRGERSPDNAAAGVTEPK